MQYVARVANHLYDKYVVTHVFLGFNCSQSRLLIWHNQKKCSTVTRPFFPHERVESESETKVTH